MTVYPLYKFSMLQLNASAFNLEDNPKMSTIKEYNSIHSVSLPSNILFCFGSHMAFKQITTFKFTINRFIVVSQR